MKSQYVGVDGCTAGWFSVGLEGIGGYECKVFKTFGELLHYYGSSVLILVDIPIGLPEKPGSRDCDREARKLLGKPRSNSVFSTPTRQTSERAAQFPEDYRSACRVERKCANAKKGISKQTFAIAPKIAEVDKILAARDVKSTPRVREVHPELCFWAFNNCKPMTFSKKTKEGKGINERLYVLKRVEPRAEDIFKRSCSKFLRKDVARDDILDALVAALTAYLGHDNLQAVPKAPQIDAKKLPMEMVYWRT